MIRITTFAGKAVAVFGLGASGNATAQALMAGGATVAAWDDSEAGRAAAAKVGVPIVDLEAAGWSRFAALVLAPGVPLTHPEPHWTVNKAKAAGVDVIGDIELFCRERAKICPAAPFIAITGTNGKSTTTALVSHILREAGKDVQMGGNIGRAILTLEPPALDRFHVIEMSSFQIDLTPSVNPTVGVLLNITTDHIDRHGTVEQYAAVKQRLVHAANDAVIGIDDAWCRGIARACDETGRRVTRIAAMSDAEVFYRAGRLYRACRGEAVADLAGVGSLRGDHNGQNAAAAFAALSIAGLDDEVIARHMRTYPGLAHRMEEIGHIGRVLFINDSKATNADSTEKALASWESGIFWILGGKSKEGGITPLDAYFPRIAKAYLIGAATEEFAAALEGKVPYQRCGTLDAALAAAARDAAASAGTEPVVLLSPACASYDQYKNFEVRGEHFRRLAAALPGIEMRQTPG